METIDSRKDNASMNCNIKLNCQLQYYLKIICTCGRLEEENVLIAACEAKQKALDGVGFEQGKWETY